MKRRKLTTVLTVAFVTIIAGLAFGVGSYLTQFNTRYGTSGSALDSCNLCHPGGATSQLNAYASAYVSAGHNFASVESLDSDGDGYTNLTEINARTNPGDAASHPVADATPPVVTAFTIPATSGSLVVAINSFTATDNVSVTGYLVTETAQKPLAAAAGWTSTPPANHTFTTAGVKTLYAWAKDAAGNVSSTTVSASVTITLADATPPTVTAFTIPVSSASLTVTISAFTATDNVGVTGYLVTETSTKPLASASGWSATRPASYACTSGGAKTLYAWAKDAAGNVSTGVVNATVNITVSDMTPPLITAFVIPSASSSLVITITSFTATDNVGVTGYLLTTTSTPPSPTGAGWTATPPGSYTFVSTGVKTLYAWAKDAAGNVSTGVSQTVSIVSGDTIPPNITNFSLTPSAETLKVPVVAFTATDDVAVTGYMLTETAKTPLPTAAGWSTTPPASYTFTSEGLKALYAWAKDAAGNVSLPWSDMVDIVVTDVTPPDVMDFSLRSPSDSLIVPITGFTAIDDVEVTGYLVTKSASRPKANAAGWSASPPTSYTFPLHTTGTKTLYGWAKDAAGNVSDGLSEQVVIQIDDRTPPTVTEFRIPSSSSSLTVRLRTFTATDNKVIAGYMVTTSSAKPSWSSPKWNAAPPASFTFTSQGTKTLYPWVRDAAGNVSGKFVGAAMKVRISLDPEEEDRNEHGDDD